MTDSQKERAEKIIEDRKELKEPEVLDLIIAFFEEANYCYQKGYSNIKRIDWCYKYSPNGRNYIMCFDKKISMYRYIISNFEPEERKMFEILQKLGDIKEEELMQNARELKKIGFQVLYSNSNNEHGIRISIP